MQRLLVIRGGAVGDLVVTLPALRALRQAFPQAVLTLLGHTTRASLAHHRDYADCIIDMERWELYRLFQLHPTLSEAMTAFFSSFALILSYMPTPDETFAHNLQRVCPGSVHTWRPHPPAEVHITEHLLQPVQRLAPGAYHVCPQLHLTPETEEAAARFWQATGLPARGVIAFHPGSGGASKLWPMPGWRQVMRWAAAQGIPGLLIRGPAEQDTTPDLPHWPCADQMPLPVLAALLARCQVVVSHDSGIAHLAAAVGATTLALFGPTSPFIWGPRSPQVCVLWPQPAGPLTLERLQPEVVLQTLNALYDGTFTYVPSRVACTMLDPVSLR
jgi:heptosyltransferase-2